MWLLFCEQYGTSQCKSKSPNSETLEPAVRNTESATRFARLADRDPSSGVDARIHRAWTSSYGHRHSDDLAWILAKPADANVRRCWEHRKQLIGYTATRLEKKSTQALEAGSSVCPCCYLRLSFMLPLRKKIWTKALFTLVWSIQWHIRNIAGSANRKVHTVPVLHRHIRRLQACHRWCRICLYL